MIVVCSVSPPPFILRQPLLVLTLKIFQIVYGLEVYIERVFLRTKKNLAGREISEWQPLYLCRLAKAPPKVWTWRSTMPNFEHGLSTASRPRPPGISCLGAKRVKSRSGRSAPSARRNRRNPKPPPRRSLGPGGEGSKKHSGRNPFYSFYKTEKKIKSNQRKCKSISKHYGI